MTAEEIRFSPPRQSWPVARRWVLGAAFAASQPAPPPEARSRELVDAATALGLGHRIGGRWGPELRSRLGVSVDVLTRASARVEAHCLRLDQGLAEVERALAECGIQGMLLKGMALRALGICAPGTRTVSDIDVLVAEGQASQLHRKLSLAGFATVKTRTAPHHLPPLADSRLGVVEIHTSIPGLHRGGSAVDFDETRRASAPLPGSEVLLVPSHDLLAAHTIAHGWIQEGHHYGNPTLRMIGDLCDLALNAEIDGWFPGARAWLAELSDAEAAALSGLVRQLTAGAEELPQPDEWPEHWRLLIDHPVALLSDQDYAWGLKLAGFSGDGSRWRGIGSFLWPSGESLQNRWGGGWSPAGRLTRRCRWFGHVTTSAGEYAFRRLRSSLGRSELRG